MIISNKIYLDTAAATALDRRVLAVMMPYLRREFANPSSIHRAGVRTKRAIEGARADIASVIGAHSTELIFTSGGTEANNLAIFGVTKELGHGMSKLVSKLPTHVITSVIEHPSVLEPCRALERVGVAVTYLPVGRDGLITPAVLARALRPETVLVSLAYANSEIGVVQPIRELAKIIRRFRRTKNPRPTNYQLQTTSYPYFHLDACQAPRFLDLNVERLGVDLMTLNGSKIYGPKGIGCLYRRRGFELVPLLFGGGQERGLKSGTENVPGIIGLAAALKLCVKLRVSEAKRLTKLRAYFIERLLKFDGVQLNGSLVNRLPNNINVSFSDADSEFLVLNLDARGVAVSAGSACSAASKDSSYVIEALDLAAPKVRAAVCPASAAARFTLDRATTKRDLDYVLKILPEILSRARGFV